MTSETWPDPDAELQAKVMRPEEQAKLPPLYRGMCIVCELPRHYAWDHVPCAVRIIGDKGRGEDARRRRG